VKADDPDAQPARELLVPSADWAGTRRATIDDVARLAGTSKSTVSRTLNGPGGAAKSELARRIRVVADDLGYSPNSAAASLRRQRSRTVGVVVPRLTDIVMAMLYEEIASACERIGQHALVATTSDEPENERSSAELLLRRGVDGLILTTARIDDPFFALLTRRDVPHVLALRTAGSGSPSSVGDDHLGGYLATRHLLDLGHRTIALVAGPTYATSAVGRAAGYRTALTEAGIDPASCPIVHGTFSMEAGEAAAAQILETRPDTTAIFAINDNTAIGVMATAQRRGVRIPTDLSIVGYNDIPLTARLATPLTSVRVPFRDIATQAILLLQDAQNGLEPRHLMFAPSLIPRASTRAL
jgi:LacI family transcriptional regulator